jgi:hypothetical protein
MYLSKMQNMKRFTNKKKADKQNKKSKAAEEKHITICTNVECRLRKAGCTGFEGCPGYKGR